MDQNKKIPIWLPTFRCLIISSVREWRNCEPQTLWMREKMGTTIWMLSSKIESVQISLDLVIPHLEIWPKVNWNKVQRSYVQKSLGYQLCGPNPLLLKEQLGAGGSLLIAGQCAGGGGYWECVSAFSMFLRVIPKYIYQLEID